MTTAARNLAIAEQNQAGLLTVCSGCFGTLFDVNHTLSHDGKMLGKVNQELKQFGFEVKANQDVKHIAQVLGFDIGPSEIVNHIKRKVNLKLAVHYGCHFLRPFGEKQIEDPDDPRMLEDYVRALGVEPVEYRRKFACCGAGGGVKAGFPDDSIRMLGEKMQAIVESDAQAILDICPFCHLQFDAGQKILNEQYGTDFRVPVLHISQLTAFCMGMDDVGMKYQVSAPEFKLEAAPLE
jgi:heterodisulfide reductase subunit B